MTHKYGYWLLVLCLVGCQPDIETADRQRSFFDLEAYFQQQIDSLNAAQPSLRKSATIGERKEEKELRELDYTEELQIFQQSHINRPAWSDKYQVDSTIRNGQLNAITYTALDTSLNTRSIIIDFAQGRVSRIQIENRSQSMIADTEQQLQYIPGSSYRIFSSQQTVGSTPRQVLIEAFWKR